MKTFLLSTYIQCKFFEQNKQCILIILKYTGGYYAGSADFCNFFVCTIGKPQPVGNCTLSNLTSGAAEVSCEPGFDGGLPQHFLLEVYSDSESEPR